MNVDSKLILEHSKNLNVLYVEDNDTLRDATKKIFLHYFKHVDEAVDGRDGLDKYHLFKKQSGDYYDLVISDINMPHMSGMEMSKVMVAENPRQSVIFITAHDEISFLHEAIGLGVDGFLNKPLNPNQLKTLLYKTVLAISDRKLADSFHEQLKFQVAHQNKRLKKNYTEDPLTGLGNINALNSKLDKKSNYALVLININKFHEINEYYGFDIGDSVLLQMANFLLETFSDIGEVYRSHNDEFAILADLENSSLSAFLKLLNTFSESMLTHMFYTNPNQIESDVSIPLQITMGLANTNHNLLKNAGIALHQAKSQYKELVYFNDDLEIEKSYKKNFEMIKTVYDAIFDNRIVAYYQPIVDNQTQKIVKYETLVRLIDMQNNILSPIAFLDVAKKGRLYEQITREVFQQSCERFANRSESFSINIELEDILNRKTNDFILNIIDTFSNPQRIVIEIVESQQLDQNPVVISFIESLKKKGCKLSIDDFGTGYSNFEYLLRLNADIIKIDGSLIKNIDRCKENQIIVESIVQFSQKMGIKTIAEFVSSESIYNVVHSMGITYSQGYYFGKPEATLVN